RPGRTAAAIGLTWAVLALVPGDKGTIAWGTVSDAPEKVAQAEPEQKPGTKPPLRKEWSLRLELDVRYDDNIIQLSDRDLNRLDNPTPNTIAANRFAIETPDDFIAIPRLSPGFKADWWLGRPTSLDLDASAYQYLRNSVKNYQSYRLSIEQALTGDKAL